MYSFWYDGDYSSDFLQGWRSECVRALEGPVEHTWTSPEGLEVLSVTHTYPQPAAMDWTIYFTNAGPEDTKILEGILALDLVVAVGVTHATLYRLNGSSCEEDDWMPFETEIGRGQKVTFGPVGGRPANGACPFFNLSWDGGGVVTAIGWTGQWEATVGLSPDGDLIMQAGMERTHLILHPGESIRTPRILQMSWEGSLEDSYNSFRKVMFAHIMPRVDGKLITPPIADLSSTCKYEHAMTEQTELDQIQVISDNDLGFEVYWIDAMYSKGGFPFGIGNYELPVERVCDPERFPRGLGPVGDAAHEAGMEFLVWFEPERVASGTYLYDKHPEWVLTEAVPPPPERKTKVHNWLDLGQEDARKHMTKVLIQAVRKFKMDWLRMDCNIDPLPFWHAVDRKNPNRVGMCEIRYVEGLYQMWDDVVEACPGLQLECCSSGDRRRDLETTSRAAALWRTDFFCNLLVDIRSKISGPHQFAYCASVNHGQAAALNRYIPFTHVGIAGSSPYLLRSGFNGGLAFVEDSSADGYPIQELRRGIVEAKRIRKYYLGDFYNLSPVSTDLSRWVVTQFHRPEEDDGMVLAFRRPESTQDRYYLGLRGLDLGAMYSVRSYHSYALSSSDAMRGSKLQGLIIQIGNTPGSLLVEYSKIG